MTDRTASSLAPEILALLRRAEPYPDAPPQVQSRVRDALMLRIAQSAAAGPGADGGSHDALFDDAPRSFSWAARPAWSLAATFIVGTAAGASLHAAFREPRERIVYVERPYVPPSRPTADSPLPAPPSASSPPSIPTSETAPPAALRPLPTAKDPISKSDLDAEQKLLDAARRALTQGRASHALPPLERHAHRYAKGILAEEREALAVNVLVTLGRYDEARHRGAQFLRRYPDSLQRVSVEAAVAAIP